MMILNQVLAPNEPVDRLVRFHRRRAGARRVPVSWSAVVNFLAPIGYQDEAGFHRGTPPAPSPDVPASLD